jgi:hypothetical protein
MKTNLISAPRDRSPEALERADAMKEAARTACREAGNNTPRAFFAAFYAYRDTYEATPICPASAAYAAAVDAVRLLPTP